jgi:hypothetical protein
MPLRNYEENAMRKRPVRNQEDETENERPVRSQEESIMNDRPDELRKLSTIATDTGFTAELRTKAIEQMGNATSKEALRALLDLAANDQLTVKERELALKQALKIIKSTSSS